MVTLDQLMACTGARLERAEPLLEPLNTAMATYDISTKNRIGMFLANVGHESGGLLWLSELWGPTPAQRRYEGRMDLGNIKAGDGSRYRGRGLLQTTGRANYRRLRDRLRARDVPCPDFEEEPEKLATVRWAAMSAADYWDMRDLNEVADRGDFRGVVRKINGGFNGLTDRVRLWKKAQEVL